jgi:phage-related protein
VFEKYGINTRAEVIKTEWDCLTERYLSIELGEPRSNFARTIVDMNDQTTQEIVEAKSEMEKAIDAATAAITGVNGGYVKINSTSDGKPYEILIMDNEDASQAVTVWRYNLAGWGVSTNGINGPDSMAATLNPTYGASINADYIIAGTMLANRIHGGILKLGGSNNGNGTLEIYNSSGTKIVTIDNNGIYYGNQKFTVDANGNVTMTGATINGGSITYTNGKFGVTSDGVMSAQDATVKGAFTSETASEKTVIDSGQLKIFNKIYFGDVNPILYTRMLANGIEIISPEYLDIASGSEGLRLGTNGALRLDVNSLSMGNKAGISETAYIQNARGGIGTLTFENGICVGIDNLWN